MELNVEGLSVPAGVELRFASPADVESLVAIEEAAMTDQLAHVFPPAEYPFPRQIIRERWAEEVLDASFRIVVAQRDDQAVGYCSCQGPWLAHIGVLPSQMGTGLAKLLMSQARRAVPSEAMHLWVIDRNERARRFYEREGWQLSEQTRIEPFPPFPTSLKYVAPPLG